MSIIRFQHGPHPTGRCCATDSQRSKLTEAHFASSLLRDLGVPSLQSTASGLGSATGVWTEATDANPAGTTKPVFQVSCGSEQLTYLNAIPTRFGFGNMQGRFAPEQIAANTDVAISVAAR